MMKNKWYLYSKHLGQAEKSIDSAKIFSSVNMIKFLSFYKVFTFSVMLSFPMISTTVPASISCSASACQLVP